MVRLENFGGSHYHDCARETFEDFVVVSRLKRFFNFYNDKGHSKYYIITHARDFFQQRKRSFHF